MATSNTTSTTKQPADTLYDSLRNLIPDQETASPINAFPTIGSDSYEEAIRRLDYIETDPHHLHVFSHKHNTHITLTRPNRDALISMSCGNIGFKKHARGTYEAAFQLSSYVMRAMTERGYLSQKHKDRISKLEIIFRGFGEGRNAFPTALLGVEGRFVRAKVISVSDSTKLKIGGNRSKKKRRL